MPEITKGYTWVSGETMTPEKLNKALDDASIPNGSILPAKLSTGAPVWDTAGNLTAPRFIGQADTALSFANNQTHRNRIINGAMRIDQRNNGSSFAVATGPVVYGVDRFYVSATGAAVTGQRVASGITAFPFALRITGATSNTNATVGQRVESVNCADLVGQSVTVSFTAAHSGSGSVSVGLTFPTATDNFAAETSVASQSVALTSTLTRYTATFSNMPSGVANGLALSFAATSGLGSGVTLTITGVQLEAGSVATPFEHRNHGYELALGQRYFEVLDLGVDSGTSSGATFALDFTVTWFYKVQKRAAPTVVAGAGSYGVQVSGSTQRVRAYATSNLRAVIEAGSTASAEL